MKISNENRVLFTCPACGKEVSGRMAVELEPEKFHGDGRVEYKGKITGIQVSHDCIPKFTRTNKRTTHNQGE